MRTRKTVFSILKSTQNKKGWVGGGNGCSRATIITFILPKLTFMPLHLYMEDLDLFDTTIFSSFAFFC